MRVGVTGAAGFIGQGVARVLDARGLEMVPFDYPSDVCDFSQALRFVKTVDAVIHLAGVLGTAETIGRDWATLAVNVAGALNVADACEQCDVPMVQIGTGHKGQPNVYAVTKACAEDLLLCRARWQGHSINVVRAFHAYGPGQKAPPPWGKATVRKIVPSFVCAALAGRPLEVHGDGSQLVDLVYVDDVARVLVDACSAPYGRTIEAGTGKATSVLQAALDVIAFTGSSSEVVHVPTPDGFIPGVAVVASEPQPHQVGWPDGLAATVGYYRAMVHA